MMQITWRSPYRKVTEELLIGNTTFRINGLYDDGEPSDLTSEAPTAPIPPSFEIDTVEIVVPTPQGVFLLDATKFIEDLNSITWRKETNNDIFEYFSEKMIEKCKDA